MSEYQAIKARNKSGDEVFSIIDDNRRIMAPLSEIDYKAFRIQETLKTQNNFTPACHDDVMAIITAAGELTTLLLDPKVAANINEETALFAHHLCGLIKAVCEDIDRVQYSAATSMKALMESARKDVKKVWDKFAVTSGFLKNPLKVARKFAGYTERVERTMWEFDCGVKLVNLLKLNMRSLGEEAAGLLKGTARFADQTPRAMAVLSHHRLVVEKLVDLRKEAGNDLLLVALDQSAAGGYDMANIFEQLRQFEQEKIRKLVDNDSLIWRSKWEGNVWEEYNFTTVIEEIFGRIYNKECTCDVIHLYGKLFSKYGAAIDSVPVSEKPSYRHCHNKQPACGRATNVFEKLTMTAADINKTKIWGKQEDSEPCPICMEDLNEVEDEFGGCMLPCGHQYHKECIMPYIRLHFPWHLPSRKMCPNKCEGGCEKCRPRQCPICKRQFAFLEAVLAVDVRIREEREERERRTEGDLTSLLVLAASNMTVSVEAPAEAPVEVPVEAPPVEAPSVQAPIKSALTRSATWTWPENISGQ